MPIKTDREYRDVYNSLVPQDDEKRVTGYATVFEVPYKLYGDGSYEIWEKVAPTAFANTDVSDVIMQYNHEGRVFARITNGTLKIDIDKPNGLLINADLGGTQLGSQVYEEIKGKYTNKMSIGFKVDRAADVWTTEQIDGRVIETRQINKIVKLYDVSAVSIPANNQTSIEAISVRALVDGEIEKLKAERLEAERLELEKKRAKLRARFLMED